MGKLILAGVVLIAATGFCQIISPEIYQTEEDLLEALQLGEITFDQYLELLDLMRQKNLSAESDSELITQIPDLDYLTEDSVDNETEQKIAEFRRTSPAKQTKAKVILQHRQNISEPSQPETYFRIEAGQGKDWNLYVESENMENQNRIKRRALEAGKPHNWNLVLGNFQPRFGLGVNVGYRTYLNFSSQNSLETENTLLFPFWTRYNGVLAGYQKRNNSTAMFYSQNRFGDYKDQVWGGAVNLRSKHWLISPIFSYQEISKGKDRFLSRAGSLYGKLFWESGEIAAEYVSTDRKESGLVVEALWQNTDRINTFFSFWSYTRDFLHPTSGGRALPDYRLTELGDLELSHRSRQAGETGAYFSTAARLNPRTKLDFAYQQWQDGNSYLNKNKLRLGLAHWFKKNFELRLKEYWEDDDLNASSPDKWTTVVVGTYIFKGNTKLQLRLNYRVSDSESGKINTTWDEVIFYFPIAGKLSSKVRLRYRDDDIATGRNSSWSFYLSENFWLAENLLLLAEFVSKEYQDLDREDLQVVRVRLEWSL